MLTLIRFHSNYLFLTLWCHWLQLPNSILFRGSLLKQYILIFHGPSSREFILSPSVSLSNTIQWRIHAGFVDGRGGGGGALDPPLVYWLGWICTVGKLALPIPPPPPKVWGLAAPLTTGCRLNRVMLLIVWLAISVRIRVEKYPYLKKDRFLKVVDQSRTDAQWAPIPLSSVHIDMETHWYMYV